MRLMTNLGALDSNIMVRCMKANMLHFELLRYSYPPESNDVRNMMT